MPWFEAWGGSTLPVKLLANSSGMNCEVGWSAWPVSLAASAKLMLGEKPPWNHPHDSPASFSRSPMFLPLIATASRVEQSSQYGWASLVSEKPPRPSPITSLFGPTVTVPAVCVMSTPPVSPDTRLIAPGEEGPKVVEYELSLSAKCCA